MTIIREADVIASVADALQYISYYHTPDFIRAMGRAYAIEQSPSARDAIAQILTNSRMCAEGHRPICQDTGIVVVFVKVGMGVSWDAQLDLESMINEGVRRDTRAQCDRVREELGSAVRAGPGVVRKHRGQPVSAADDVAPVRVVAHRGVETPDPVATAHSPRYVPKLQMLPSGSRQ